MNAPGAPLTATARVEVPFHDVDAMNVCWHGHYLKYFESGRAALLRMIDYDYPAMLASGYMWPVVEAHLKYVRPATYGQQLDVRTTLLEFENRLRIGYEIVDAGSGERLTKGYTVQLAIDAATRELQFVSPAALIERVQAR
ncbi:acyl-CoA thioesterase [Burkholderia sp. MS455]|uniref:Acyl-CoA thioester hydrolase n=1 Tax=Burkholderia pyrrocinia TaxID=60550 RepID=A0A318JK22_BURPY|nr:MULTISPECIES: thioesterase family protein [Burkholderia]PXX40592.1 acyl-CoA thioester hydrolase [Burkholderia pyrrocinia]QRR06772.1 acyl-CoA thioesterase [Burkholderia sp. MS455]SFW28596.1 acyl-CoA thioester hydrolase [Burkholderia sp. NFACC33-1]SFX39031.1 acyl-CoA thioester hydrolase [Burkholderia sp. NFPP32]